MFAHPGVTQTTDGSREEALSFVRIRTNPPHTHTRTQRFRACGSGLELCQLPPSSPSSAAGQSQENARKTPSDTVMTKSLGC